MKHEFDQIRQLLVQQCLTLLRLIILPDTELTSINQSINQISMVPISPAKPGSMMRESNHCLTAKSMKQFRNNNKPSAMLVSMGKRPMYVLRCFLRVATEMAE